MDRLKLHRVVKSTVNGKEFQTLTTRLARKLLRMLELHRILCNL